MTLKRRSQDEGCPAAKRAKVMDFEGAVGSLVGVFWQHSSEEQTRVTLKRKEHYDGDHPAAKRARLSKVEDTRETFGLLGRTFLQECPEDPDDDGILILDDDDLVREMDNLFNDLTM